MDYSFLIVFLTSVVFPCLFYLANRNVRLFLAQLVILPAFVTAYYLIIAFVDWALEPVVALAAVPLFHFVMVFFVNRNFIIKAKSFRPVNRAIFAAGFLTALLLVTLSVTLNDSRFITYFQPFGVVVHLAAIFINTLYHCLKERQLVSPLKRTYMAMLFAWPILLYCSSWIRLAIETLFGSENALHFTYIFFGIVQGLGTWSMLSEATRSDREAKAKARELERVLEERDKVIREQTAELTKKNRELEIRTAWQDEAIRKEARLVEELRRVNNRLTENYNRRKSYFELTSHESKTALNLIRDNLTLLEGQLDRSKSEYENVVYQVDRLYDFFSEMLREEALEQGCFNLAHSRVVDLSLFVMQKVNLSKTTVKQRGKWLNSTIPLEQIEVKINPNALDSLLNNLLGNASKYAPIDSTIDVVVENREQEAVLKVINDNPGELDAEYFRRNMERFVQERPESDGVGLGLSFVDEIVKRVPGASLTFTASERVTAQIILPKTVEEAGEEQHNGLPDSRNRLLDEPPHDESKSTIMAVENNIGMLNNYIRFFGEKYNIICAASGQTALRRLKKGPQPDLIITDNLMPGMNGLELCKTLQKSSDYRMIPLIFISAKDDDKSRIEALESGAVDYIDKPVKMEEVLARVKSQLKSARLRGESERDAVINLLAVPKETNRFKFSEKELQFIKVGLKLRREGQSDSYEEIGRILDLSRNRSKNIAERVRGKMNQLLPAEQHITSKDRLFNYFTDLEKQKTLFQDSKMDSKNR